jgi:hypothetical protein
MKRGQGRGTDVCYHVPTAADAKHTLLVACEVPNAPGDRDGLSPMALQAKAVLGGGFDAVADVGDDHGREVKACLEAGLTPAVARPLTAANGQVGRVSTADFT